MTRPDLSEYVKAIDRELVRMARVSGLPAHYSGVPRRRRALFAAERWLVRVARLRA